MNLLALILARLRFGTGGLAPLALLSCLLSLSGGALADVPGRALPSGAVPNPGTQQQELANITAPAEWNVFEFVVTCGACHGGTVDQHVGHFGNWAGGNMASAARDPVFRANQIGVNNTIKAVTGQDGAGNVCFRCHSPNGWLSGRFDPTLGGKADGSNMIQSILLSTDNEGIMCETCHRSVGNVTYKRADVATNADTGMLDKVWNLLAGLFDWEHAGKEVTDQAGDSTMVAGNPFGDTSLQFLDGMTYVGKYSGMTDIYYSDLPVGGSYTGQIYGVYPDWWASSGNPMNPVPAGMPAQNSAGQYLAYNLDGTLPPLFEVPVGTPTSTTTGYPDMMSQAYSIEHPTVGGKGRKTSAGDTANTLLPVVPEGPGGSVSANNFIRTSEFCGTCHELTVPVLNHGMPEQRTFSEWKFSSYAQATNIIADPLGKRTGAGVERCQDCHMPTLKHEYTDADTGSYNADPWLVGGFPYGKNRGAQGGTAVHKLTGANRDLPMMMKALYPEVDLEVIGAPTGMDPRVFPGMLSDRGPMWDRAQYNTEITLRDGVDVRVIQAPVETTPGSGIYEMTVRVTNKSGHRIPSGYPDGRRFWLSVDVKDAGGNPVYASGYYDAAAAELRTTSTTPFNRALGSTIDATVANAVMVYERVTGTCADAAGVGIFPDPQAGAPAACNPSPSLLNNFILFDNRIPPKGLDYAQARLSGVKFWNYDPTTYAPYEDSARFGSAELAGGYDDVTYRFAAAPGAVLTASAEVYWQTHTREFMEHLRTQDDSTVRPEGPPNPLDPLYPMNPTYLSNSIAGQPLSAYTALDGSPLNDNWGGVAYAAWLATGKGAPFMVDRDDTAVTLAPAKPTLTVRALNSSDPEYIDPVTLAPDLFAAKFEWAPVPEADGYTIWIRYGTSDATADWDRLVTVGKDQTSHIEHVLGNAALNGLGKTYGFKVVAFNGKGETASDVVTHKVADALPNAPTNLTASNATPGSTNAQITLTWMDNATNEAGFEVWRYGPVSIDGIPQIYNGLPPLTIIGPAAGGGIGSQTAAPGQTGINTYVDTADLLPVACYNYQVRAVTANVDVSTFAVAANAGCTVSATQTLNLTAMAGGYRVDLSWSSNATGVTGFTVKRNGVVIGTVAKTAAVQYSYADTTAQPATTYTYTVEATGSNPLVTGSATVVTLDVPKAPTNVQTTPTTTQITVRWTDNANNEDGFVLERSANGGAYVQVPGVGAFFGPNTTSFVDTVAGGLLYNVVYQYRVKAINLVNGDSTYAVSAPVSLLVPPAAPSNFVATLGGLPGSLPTVNLSWLDNANNEESFGIERRTGSCVGNFGWGNASTVGAVAGSGSIGTASFTNVSANTSYCYRIRSQNAAANSEWLTVAVTVPAAPATPSAPMIDGATTSSLVVNFTVPANAIGYEIRRGNMTIVAQQSGNGVVAYTDSGLNAGTTYTYSVRIASAGGWSSWSSTWGSNGDGTTLLPPPPTAPADPEATRNGRTATITWTDNSSDETGFRIERKTQSGTTCTIGGNWGNAVTVGANVTTTTISRLSSWATYCYRVRANGAGGNNSDWAYSATPQ